MDVVKVRDTMRLRIDPVDLVKVDNTDLASFLVILYHCMCAVLENTSF